MNIYFSSPCSGEEKCRKSKYALQDSFFFFLVGYLVWLKLQVYNGKYMISREIKPEMISHELGEFATTRKKS